MKRAASTAALTLIVLAATAPTGVSAAANDVFGFYSTTRPFAEPRVIRRHRSYESRDRRHEKSIAAEVKPAIPPGPLQIVVSINRQRVTLFASGHPVTTSNVSTGTPGHPTPMGVFTVIQKDRHHFSNLYDAPMPYMQRITWSGSALHEGPLPGRPASHGCIRLTGSFAEMLWKVTKIGARVIVTRDEAVPVDIDLPDLFVARPKTVEAPVESSVKAAAVPTLRPALVPVGTANLPPVQPEPTLVKTADATGRVPVQVAEATANGPASKTAANATAPEQATKSDLDKGADPAAVNRDPAVPPTQGITDATTPAAQRPAAPESTSTVQAPAGSESSAAQAPASPSASAPATPTAASDDAAKPTAPVAATVSAPSEAPSVILPASPPLPPSRREATKSKEPISVFVSRRQGKLYVRQKWTPLFDMPITIENPNQPLGTHVFTAMEPKGDGMRWTVISIPSGFKHTAHKTEEPRRSRRQPYHDVAPEIELPVGNAHEALSRINFPPEAVARIAELMKPGSSLIISDNRLSDETSEYSDFIVLTP